jgi:hypothetical protein
MLKRFRNKTAAASIGALIAALGVGGVALAQSSGSSSGQQGQTQMATQARDSAGSEATGSAEQGKANEEVGSNEQESSSEAPGNDGPGGHADEPGNPNANHEAQGQE